MPERFPVGSGATGIAHVDAGISQQTIGDDRNIHSSAEPQSLGGLNATRHWTHVQCAEAISEYRAETPGETSTATGQRNRIPGIAGGKGPAYRVTQ